MEQSLGSIERLKAATDELIKVINSQQEHFKQQLENEKNKVSALEANVQTLTTEKEQLQISLNAAQNNTEAENKIKELQNELENRNNKISGLQTELQNLNNALNNRKAQIEELTAKNAEKDQKITEAENKIAILEQNSSSSEDAVAQIQRQLDEEQKQHADLQQKYELSEQKMLQMQQTIEQTGENIDDIVARLEKVLEENGASNNNN